MMQDNSKIIERWMRQQLFRIRETALEKLVLKSMGVGSSRGSEVEQFPVVEVNNDNVAMLVDEVLSRAQSDADGLGNKVQRYILIAREVGRNTDVSRLAFRVRGEGGDDSDEGEDPPTEKGLVSQLMRHNEALMRMNIMSQGAMLQQLSRRVESSEKRVEDMVAQRMHDLKVLEDAKTQQHERDMQMLLTSGQEERKGEMFKKLDLLFPLIINKLAGKAILPTTPESDVFTKLANSLTQDQLVGMAPLLSPEQQMLLMTLIKAAREQQAS